jgi:two-component system sensor histidine kinase DesK
MRECEKSTPGDYIWLAYSIFFFFEPISRNNPRYWLQSIAIYAVFLGLYTGLVENRNSRRKLIFIAALALLGLSTLKFNGGASCFLTFAAAFLPFVVDDIPTVLGCMAAGSLAAAAEGFFLQINWINTVVAVFMIWVVGSSNIFIAMKKRASLRLLQAQEQNVALAAVAERERIARDLHDVLGHTLSVIVLKAELAGRLLTSEHARDPERAAREIGEVERTARTALAEVREAIGGYRARGLAAEIEAARRTLDAAGVTLLCDAMPSTNTGLHANEETVLALALREAVTNIVRHACATTCTLRFHIEDNQHRLSVEDNGQHVTQREGNGLRGMRERVEALGGRVSLDRSAGTRLLIALPAHTESHAA